MHKDEGFIRWKEVHALTGLSRTLVWRLEKQGQFPKRRRVTLNLTVWERAEVEAWMEARRQQDAPLLDGGARRYRTHPATG